MKREIASRLDHLAEVVHKNHGLVCEKLRAAVEHALVAGEALIEAKTLVGHGDWLPWLQQNCDLSERTAQAYMRLARAPLENRNALRLLPLREALASIAKPRSRYVLDLPCGCEVPAPCNCGAPFTLEFDGEVIKVTPRLVGAQ